MENIEILENVKSIAETDFKMYFVINTQGKEFLQIFYRSLQLVFNLKNQHTDFLYFYFPYNSFIKMPTNSYVSTACAWWL